VDSGIWEADTNPYAAPRASLERGALTDFYRTDSRRFSYGEYWRLSPNPLGFLIAATLKTLRVSLPHSHAFGYPHELALVAWEDIEPYVKEKWGPRLRQCEEAGFHRLFCYCISCCGITREGVCCVLQSDDRLYTVGLNYVRVENATVVKEVVTTTLSSRLRDDRRVVAVDYRNYLDPAPDQLLQFVPRKSIAEMWERHRDWIAEIGGTPVPRDPSELPQAVLQREQQLIEHMVGRGLYVRLSARELAQIERRGGAQTAPAVLNRPVYRFLSRAERVLLIVMVVGIVLFWINPDPGGGPLIGPLTQLLLLVGSLGGIALVKVAQLALKRSHQAGS